MSKRTIPVRRNGGNGTKWLIAVAVTALVVATVTGASTYGARIAVLEECVKTLKESAKTMDGKLDAILVELRR